MAHVDRLIYACAALSFGMSAAALVILWMM
jgi:hypothetical protein